jgi:hypothetical protein
MKPLADYSCLSKKCETPDGAPVYELPVESIRCPVCGSKRIRRLFNKIGVIGLRAMQPDADWRLTSNSALQRSKALLQDSFDAAEKQKASAQEMPTWGTGNVEREVSTKQGKFLVPSRQDLARQFGLAGPGAPMTQIEVAREIKRDRLSVPAVLHELNKKPIPTVVVGQPR